MHRLNSCALAVGAFALAASAASARAETRYVYLVPDVPLVGAACDAAARDVAERFHLATATTIDGVACYAAPGATTSNIRIHYLAAAELHPVSTDRQADELPPQIGRYAQRSECEASLRDETDAFTRLTGLAAVVAYCRYDSYNTVSPWNLRVEGFGNPALRPFRADASFLSPPPDERALANAVRDLVATHGATVRDVRAGAVATEHFLAVFYYAPRAIPLVSKTLARVEDPTQCAEQTTLLRSAIEAFSGPRFYAFCGRTMNLEWRLETVAADAVVDSTAESEDEFVAYKECMDERADAVQRYTAIAATPVFGGLCTKRWSAAPGESAWAVTYLRGPQP
jgi:hypothetical protein